MIPAHLLIIFMRSLQIRIKMIHDGTNENHHGCAREILILRRRDGRFIVNSGATSVATIFHNYFYMNFYIEIFVGTSLTSVSP